MARSYSLLGVYLLIALGIPFTLTRLPADDEVKKKAEEQRKTAYVRAMRTMAEGLTVTRLSADGETECPMLKDAVLNWSDSARHPDLLVPGTTWIWHNNGRPLLIGEIYGRDNGIDSWNLYACSLSADQLQMADGPIKIKFDKGYYDPKEVADAPVPAKKKSERTVQMRNVADRFDAHQFWKERFELRLLPKPIYRYEDPDNGIIDGAVYALVHGTNPEVLLLVEAHEAKDGARRWKVAFGSLAGARCVVRLDGKEYWTCPAHTGDPADPRKGFNKYVAVTADEPKPK